VREFSGGKAVLELCCGAGRICLELARAGFNVTGIDLDDRMLAFARQAAATESQSIRTRLSFDQADVCTFDLGRQFDFIIFEDDGFVYLLDQEDQLACLQQVVTHLTDCGRFLLIFNTPQRELDDDHEREFTYDPLTQIKTCACTWAATGPDGERVAVREGFERRRMTYRYELDLLLKGTGLEVLSRWGDLNCAPFTDPRRQEYHYLCRRV